ncbi:MAG: rRNA (guanosine-2-O-)-methyltransferase rlmB rRNA Gm2251 2-O-methyltransferase [Pseudomonadota bacterium]|jgi:23S rRNA (guanosine2251-2'-O)-methyltransferase
MPNDYGSAIHKIYGFHAITARIKQNPQTISCIWLNKARLDKRMQQLVDIIKHHGINHVFCNIEELHRMVDSEASHQGVVAEVEQIKLDTDIDSILDKLAQNKQIPNLLILDGITDPHNLGACFRVADAVGVHAIIAPKDNSAMLNATVAKVASGATENIPYLTVTNLARTMTHLQERGIWLIGTSDKADYDLYSKNLDLKMPLAWVMGAEGSGMRKNVAEKCDFLVSIPMAGIVSSLNISVATGVCLYETLRQRSLAK